MTFAAIFSGAVLALSALLLRRLEEFSPDPGDIQQRQGMGHLLTGVLGWLSLLIFIVSAAVMGGALPLAGLVLTTLLMLRVRSLGPRARRFYRWQLPLAAASLLFGVVALLSLLEALQGIINV